ncbi:hypothetical protein V5O48_012821 [Marasmius crinis-equi]|uniref:DH domain-containing protein n=1 Tax=Marasmius crinis-equi TaxID=585013 RepID=A0ABR3F1S5_9AGAR
MSSGSSPPRSRRVGIISPPKDLDLDLNLDVVSPDIFPPIPARSPLRPTLLGPKLPTPPSSEDEMADQESIPEATTNSTTTTIQQPQQPPLSKRQHALLELLASERAYASDLALVRDVYIPLALGHPAHIDIPPQPVAAATATPITPPNSSASSSRTLSTASSDSGPSAAPMTPEDAKIIFNNIAHLAELSDLFCDQIQEALGNVLEGGEGEDRVGELFLSVIPTIHRPYKTYITRHPTADSHLSQLTKSQSQNPLLESYFSQTRAYSTSISHAWDLHSLLIKPVQRLLKYPLLLSAITESTDEGHSDKEALRKAKEMVEVVARDVNEERRRAEVVRGVLMGDSGASSTNSHSSGGGQGGKKSPGTPTILAASVNLGKMRSLRRNGGEGKGQGQGLGGEAEGSTHSEAAKVEKLASELKRIEVFAQQFARDVVEWAKSASAVTRNLQVWAEGFARVIGLNEEQGSEAFDAFIGVIQEGLVPLGGEMERAIQELLLGDLARLVSTMRQPVKLLKSMEETEPYHHHLLNMPVSAKNRPPAALLEASTNYLALRGQLAAELPTYLGLLEKGLEGALRRLTEIQTRYWMDVRDRWGELWEMLRVEGEMNAGCEETVGVWRTRWGDVDEGVRGLGIVSSVVSRVYERERREREQDPVLMPAPISEQWMQSQTKKDKKDKKDKKKDKDKDKEKDKDKGPTTSNAVASVLASLDPTHSHPMSPVSSSASTFSKTRNRGLSDASFATTNTSASASSGRRDSEQRAPNSPQSQSSQKPRPRANDWDDYFPPPEIAGLGGAYGFSLPRTRSMPLPKGGKPSASDEPWKIPLPSPVVEDLFYRNEEGERGGRVGRKGSLKRRGVEERPVPTPTASAPMPTTTRGQGQGRASLPANMGFSNSPPAYYPPSPEPSSNFRHHSTPNSHTHPRSQSTSRSVHSSHTHSPLPSQSSQISQTQNQTQESWSTAPVRYTCLVVHACKPPAPVSYHGFPFFTLKEGECFDVLHEAGHPGTHRKLPLYVDDGEDCLLLCRRRGEGEVGWALASFLEPLEGWDG